MIVALKEINNTREERDFWESHYINNVYPECVNIDRFERTLPAQYKRDYYLKNRERIIERITKYRKENKEKVNAQRREWYQKNKERILEERRLERLANL